MAMDPEECRRQALSDAYYDFIGDLQEQSVFNQILEEEYCVQRISEQYVVLYYQSDNGQTLLFESPYGVVPKCYGLADTESLNAAGIDRIQQYPGLELTGRDVLLGFVDTGISYENRVFRKKDGTTRIAGIWDQEDQSGTVPPGFFYGSEYSREQIDLALTKEDPLSVVPSVDAIGHGTSVAAIAAGSPVPEENFSGAAPEADIAVVKLKQAKKNLRDFYLIREDAPAYQENDIMLGVLYLQRLSYRLQKPLVICLALGTNLGDHGGNSPLGVLLNQISRLRSRSVVVAAGNEANAGHHFHGVVDSMEEYQDVEIRVGPGERGFLMELWSATPELYAVSILSPSGERLPRVPVGLSRVEEYRFLFENTLLQVKYQIPESTSGDYLVLLRFENPTAGIWTIRVYPVRRNTGDYHIWLPITDFLSSETYFLRSSPDVTLTEPSGAQRVITVGAYDSFNNSIDINSGRGYSRTGAIKPELCAPGINVLTGLPGDRFGRRSGTSMAAGITAGAAALLLEWFWARDIDSITNADLKGFLIGGTTREAGRTYPNRECGYGSLDLYRTFEELRIR